MKSWKSPEYVNHWEEWPQTNAIKSLMAEVCIKRGITDMGFLASPSRQADLNVARQEVMWRAANEIKASTPLIGACLNRDHTTVIHGIKAYQNRLNRQKAGLHVAA